MTGQQCGLAAALALFAACTYCIYRWDMSREDREVQRMLARSARLAAHPVGHRLYTTDERAWVKEMTR